MLCLNSAFFLFMFKKNKINSLLLLSLNKPEPLKHHVTMRHRFIYEEIISSIGLAYRPTQLRARQREISRLEINKAARLAIVGSNKAMAFSILYWSNYTAGTSKLMRKSEVAVQSEHVLKFVFDKEAQFIRGIVQASMRDRSYQVTVSS